MSDRKGIELNAPVALFVFNRFDHTKRTVEALSSNYGAELSDLYVFSDGPRSDDDVERVDRVRGYLSTISGFKRVKVIERKKNHGLARNIIEGVSRLLKKYGRMPLLYSKIK